MGDWSVYVIFQLKWKSFSKDFFRSSSVHIKASHNLRFQKFQFLLLLFFDKQQRMNEKTFPWAARKNLFTCEIFNQNSVFSEVLSSLLFVLYWNSMNECGKFECDGKSAKLKRFSLSSSTFINVGHRWWAFWSERNGWGKIFVRNNNFSLEKLLQNLIHRDRKEIEIS